MMLNLMDSYTLFFLAHPFKALAIQSIGLERSKRSLPRAASFFYEHLIFIIFFFFLVGWAGEDLCRIFVQVLGYIFTCLQHCMGAFCKGGNRSREGKVLGSQMAENRITSGLREFSPSSMTKSWRVGESVGTGDKLPTSHLCCLPAAPQSKLFSSLKTWLSPL